MIPTLTTERLRLRPPMLEDADALYGVMAGEGVLEYFPVGGELTREKVTTRIQRHLDHWRERDYGIWVVEELDAGSMVGSCGLQFLPDAGAPEIDFLLGRDHWGKGYATEAARVALAWGFDTRQFPLIMGIVHVDNAASRHVLRKLGMTLVKRAQWFGMPCEQYELRRENGDG